MKVPSIKNIFRALTLVSLLFILVKVNQIHHQLNVNITKHPKKFSLNQITNQFPNNPEWDVKCQPDLINYVNILSMQSFYWLGKGLQCCAFVSQDGQYVLKFFYQKRLTEKDFFDSPVKYLFNARFREKLNATPHEREEIFHSSKLAFEEFPEEAGIIYVHLNTTQGKLRGIRLYDPTGESHRVKPDITSFILQRKASYIVPTLSDLMDKGHIEIAKTRLNQIFDLLFSCAKKGFVDADNALVRNNNIGFTKDRCIYIDTGHISKKKSIDLYDHMKKEFDIRLLPLYDWLKISYPELAVYWDTRKAEIFESIQQAQKNE
jgi:hypothetical protein